MPGLLALDLATATGWAHYGGGQPLSYGTRNFPTFGSNTGGFLDAFAGWLRAKIEGFDRPDVVFESPILLGSTSLVTLRKLYGLAGVTELVCLRMKIDCSEANLSSIRAHFLGKGGPKDKRPIKARVIAECRERGWEPRDDNAADALALLDFALSKRGERLPVPATPIERAIAK